MKSAARLKFTATGAASGTSASTLTVSAAITGFRTLATAIADDAGKPNGIVVGDTNVVFTSVDSAGNWETSRYTVSSVTGLTRTRVLSSSAGGTAAATFNGGTLTVFQDPSAEDYSGGLVDMDDVGFDIIVIAGQSNAAGRGILDSIVDVSNSRVFQWGSDNISASNPTLNKISIAVEPLSHAENIANTGVGPGLAFGRAYAASIPANRLVLLVPCAVGSTALVGGPWMPNNGANNLTYAISQAQAALAAAQTIHPNSRIVGAIWAQGEADAGLGVAGLTYTSTLKALIAQVRSNLSAPQMWFMIHGMNQDNVSNSGAAWSTIQTALSNTATQTDHCMFVAGPSGNAAYNNGVHFTSAGYRILGAASARAVASARRYLAPVTNASAVVISPSPASVVVNNPVTVTVTTDNPLTGSQTQQITMTAPMPGTWSPSNVVNLSASTTSASPTFTPTQTGSGNITATVTGTLSISANSPALASTAAAVAPNAVTGLTAGTATSSAQPLTWTAPSTGTAPITYKVESSPTGANTWTQAATGVTTASYTVTGLSASTAYDYRVTPSGPGGTGPATTLSNVSTAAAVAASFTTWSTTDKAATLATTDGLTVTNTLGSSAGWASIRSVASRSSGKYYFEVTPSSSDSILIGVDDGTTTLADFVGQDAGGWGYYSTGATYHAGGGVAGVTGVAYTTNITIGVAFDMDNRTIEWFRNGVSIGKTANATLLAKPMYAMATTKDKSSPAMGFTANFGASAFKYAPPTGFVGFA